MHSDKRPLPAMMVPAIPSYPPQGSVYCSLLSLKSRYWPSSAFTGWWRSSNHWVKCRPSHNSHPLLNMFLTQDGEFKISLILVCSFPSSSLILLSIDSLSLSFSTIRNRPPMEQTQDPRRGESRASVNPSSIHFASLSLSLSGAISVGEMYSQPVLHGHTGDMPPGPQLMGGGDMQVLPPPMVQQQAGGYPPSHPPPPHPSIIHQGMLPQPHGELHPPVSILFLPACYIQCNNTAENLEKELGLQPLNMWKALNEFCF